MTRIADKVADVLVEMAERVRAGQVYATRLEAFVVEDFSELLVAAEIPRQALIGGELTYGNPS